MEKVILAIGTEQTYHALANELLVTEENDKFYMIDNCQHAAGVIGKYEFDTREEAISAIKEFYFQHSENREHHEIEHDYVYHDETFPCDEDCEFTNFEEIYEILLIMISELEEI